MNTISVTNEYGTFQIPKNKRRAKRAKKAIFILSFIAYPMFLFIVYWLCVNVNSILMAFRNPSITAFEGMGFAGFKNFATFLKLMKESDLGQAFVNSFTFYGISLLICMPLYIIFSYMIFKKCFMAKTIRSVAMLPQIISGFVFGMLFKLFIYGNKESAPLSYILSHMGVDVGDWGVLYVESLALGIIIFYNIWLSFGTNLVVYPNAMKEINDEIFESARLDGVTTMWQELRHIILPLIFPTISTFLITGVAGIFTTDAGLLSFYTVEQGAPSYVNNVGFWYTTKLLTASPEMYPVMAAGGILMTLIIAPLTLLVKWLLERFGPSTEAR